MSILQGSIRNDKEALVEVNINDILWDETKGMVLHPAVIGGLLQAPGALGLSDLGVNILPIQIRKLRVYGGAQKKMYIHLQSMLSSITSIKPRPSRDEEVNVVVPLTDNNKDIEKLRETLNEYRYVAIIINSDFDENYGGIERQRAVSDYLLWLKVVVECINEGNEKHDISRLLIAFYNTWTIDEMNTKSTIMIPDNIIHSSLWGGARSIQRELGTLATHLLDLRELEETTDIEQLLIVFDKLASDWLHNVPASNKVVVPISCCMPLSSIPFYKPGLLSTLVSLWTLASSVKVKKIIVLRERSCVDEELFLSLLRYGKVEYKLLTPEELSEETQQWKKKQMICFMQLDKSHVDIIMRKNFIIKIYAFSSLLPTTIAAILRTRLSRIRIHRVNENDIFSKSNISAAIRHGIYGWLNKNFQNTINQRNVFPNLQDPIQKLFTMTHLDLQDKIGLEVSLHLTLSRLLSKTSVVGGLTGLGWQCVQWLATHQAGYVLIFNRRTPNEENTASIEEFSRSTSCTIECYSVDVVNLSSVTGAIRTFNKTYSDVRIKGVLHGAGVTRDSSLFKMTEEHMTECFNPKISGAWNLHQATMYMNLDFFILHSSITAVLGAPGQSNYGVGNAFQDSLISVRKKLSLPIQTLNWGPLDMGMLEKGKGNDRTRMTISSTGYHLIGNRRNRCLS
ncbi:hypothetical protein LOTGIDRAFT_158394 [Lottia gigantea]|uniref:Ketoreductase domain-containing protein n=1 Tax=Lottia gigantea TaxID=225164 RepID=V4A5V3_LOTGI|nr:hypothetical protein LOTGIDRAFT_158394 [Lottia gigantea]ESO99313.1 hypothetical protein LOTGIDRAFT_158394 [Lottia gigantea]